jgi:hypothetical protein
VAAVHDGFGAGVEGAVVADNAVEVDAGNLALLHEHNADAGHGSEEAVIPPGEC